MEKVLCFGEVLLRYSMPTDFPKNQNIFACVGGAESNVALALARWKVPVGYCTVVPKNFIAEKLISYYNAMGVNTKSFLKTGNRIGSYYLNQGADLKNAEVIYDRNNSSFTELTKGIINWDEILQGVTWFHFTAISPAISANIADVCEEALKECLKRRITISIDLNYREKLWKYGKKPEDVIPKLAEYADVIMGNIWAEQKMLGISLDSDIDSDSKVERLLEQSKKSCEAIKAKFPKCKTIANTFRMSDSEGLKYFATLHKCDLFLVSNTMQTMKTIDKVGSGDCFMAGLIYGLIKRNKPQEIIDFAARAAFQKLFIVGDATTMSVEEINGDLLSV